jgi:hypothetical protein
MFTVRLQAIFQITLVLNLRCLTLGSCPCVTFSGLCPVSVTSTDLNPNKYLNLCGRQLKFKRNKLILPYLEAYRQFYFLSFLISIAVIREISPET